MFIIIAGHPATGKTTVAKRVSEMYPTYKVFHTDDYIEYGYKESLYKLMDDILHTTAPGIIVEGIMGARLMRKYQEYGQQENVSHFVYITANHDTIRAVYDRERPDKKINIDAVCKGLDTVYKDIISVPFTWKHISPHINGNAHQTIHDFICLELA